MVSLIEDYNLVGFETLAVEVIVSSSCLISSHSFFTQDKNSMVHLTRAIDRATGYVFIPPAESNVPPGTMDASDASSSARPNTYALFSSAAGSLQGPGSDIRDIQERWIDAKEEWDAFEKTQWRREGELVQDEAARKNSIRERRDRPPESPSSAAIAS